MECKKLLLCINLLLTGSVLAETAFPGTDHAAAGKTLLAIYRDNNYNTTQIVTSAGEEHHIENRTKIAVLASGGNRMKRIEKNTVLQDSINGLEMIISLSGYAILDNTW